MPEGVSSSEGLGNTVLELTRVPWTRGSGRLADAGRADEWRERAIRGEAANDRLTVEVARSADQELADASGGQRTQPRSAALCKSSQAKREQKPPGS